MNHDISKQTANRDIYPWVVKLVVLSGMAFILLQVCVYSYRAGQDYREGAFAERESARSGHHSLAISTRLRP
jgi:hypothetical protein